MVSVGTENLFDSFSLLEKLGHGPWRLIHTALGRLLILHGNLDTFVHAIIILKSNYATLRQIVSRVYLEQLG